MTVELFTTPDMANEQSGIGAFARRQIDRIIEPERQRELYNRSVSFSKTWPLLSSFIYTQCVSLSMPLLLCLACAVWATIFTIGLAIMGILGCISGAVLVLVPTLSLIACLATGCWVWGVAGIYIIKGVYFMLSTVAMILGATEWTAPKREDMEEEER